MTNRKKIGLVLTVAIVIGAVWYLEAIQAHPGAGAGAGQAISVDSASSTAATTTGTGAPGASESPNNSPATNASIQAIAAADKAAGDQPAIEIVDPTGFVNVSSTFTLKSLVGKKVILLDFWTYSCINCIRTLPYLTAWYTKYKNDGLEIVGIHTPEFDFEKNIANVEKAATQYGITYPIVLDSNYGTWDAYNNLYWPHEYLIDIAGYIVHDHVGEGDYGETEAEIQNLLMQRATALGSAAGNTATAVPTSTVNITPADLSGINSPETYFGANRNALLANGTSLANGIQNLTLPASSNATLNQLYLGGTWDFEDEYATNHQAGATVLYTYDSGKMYFVASAGPNAPSGGVTVEVMQDGAPIPTADAGSDVVDGKVTITSSRLYNLVNNHDGPGEHTIELIVDSPGLEAFTFTFG
jgi:thiol-disulfide isomerase/thioredoxin